MYVCVSPVSAPVTADECLVPGEADGAAAETGGGTDHPSAGAASVPDAAGRLLEEA